MSPSLRRALSLIGFVLALLCLAYFLREFLRQVSLPELGEVLRENKAALAVTLALYCLAYIPLVLGWNRLFLSCGSQLGHRQATTILLISQIGKYLPGNVGHFIGRTVLAKAKGTPIRVTSAAMLLEIAAVLLAAGLILLGASMLGLSEQEGRVTVMAIAIGAAIAALVAVHLILSRQPERATCDAAAFAAATLLFMSVFVLITAANLALLFAISDVSLDAGTTAIAASAVLVSWVAGFLTPGAPAGIGIREIGLVALLGPIFPADAILVAAAGFRLVTLAGDLLAFLLGLALARPGK